MFEYEIDFVDPDENNLQTFVWFADHENNAIQALKDIYRRVIIVDVRKIEPVEPPSLASCLNRLATALSFDRKKSTGSQNPGSAMVR